MATDAGRTRERNQRNTAVVVHHIAGRVTAHQGADAAGQVIVFQYFSDNFLAGHGTKRYFGTGFPDTHVAADPSQGRVPRPHGHREVEGGNHAYHTQRVPLLVHTVPGTLAVHGEPVQLARKTHGKIADVDHFLHLAQPFLVRFTHFVRNEGAQFGFYLTQFVAELANDFATLRSGHRAPGFVRLGVGFHHLFVVGGVGRAHFGDKFSVGGRKRFDFGTVGNQCFVTYPNPALGILDAQCFQGLFDGYVHKRMFRVFLRPQIYGDNVGWANKGRYVK